MESTSEAVAVLILHEDEAVRESLRSALEPQFAVTVGDEAGEHGFDVRIVSDELHQAALYEAEVAREAQATEQERQRRLLADANRALKQQQRDLAATNQRLEEANEKLRRYASTDGLTGLYNHRYFQVTWRREITRARRYGEELSVMLLDLDHFKGLNDLFGHPEGDIVLRELAQLLLRGVRAVDLVARYGGEEFVVSLPRTGKDAAMLLADRLRARVEAHSFTHGDTQPSGILTVSIGVATFPIDGETAGEILGRADRAMYRAKRAGRNLVLGADSQDRAGETQESPVADTDTGADFEALVTGSQHFPPSDD
jgi:diguanylate cyclase (GGDEF)-like protein